MADAAGDEMTENDWKFPEGRFLSYVMGPVEPGGRDLYRTERRPRRDRIQIAQNGRVQKLAADPEYHRCQTDER